MQSVLNYNISKEDLHKEPEEWKPKAQTALSMQQIVNARVSQSVQNPMQQGQTVAPMATSNGFGRSV